MVTNEYLKFNGKIYVVHSSSLHFKDVIDLLNTQTIVGFDTETRPSFKKGKSYSPSLIQFATKEFAVLYQIRNRSIAKEIIEILENKNIIKIGAGVTQDVRQLQTLVSFTPQSFVDVQQLASAAQIESVSLKKLCELLLGKQLSKRQQLSNWENPELTEPQKIYAATDAYVCLLIYEKLNNGTT